MNTPLFVSIAVLSAFETAIIEEDDMDTRQYLMRIHNEILTERE